MTKVIDFPIASRCTIRALAALPGDAAPEAWPREELGKIGLMAAALITDRVDALPADVAQPDIVWQQLPRELQMIVNERNPGMARACAAEAERLR